MGYQLIRLFWCDIFNLSCGNEVLLIRILRNGLSHISPDKVPVLRKVVPLRPSCCVPATLHSLFHEAQIYIAEILHMRHRPQILPSLNLKPLPTLQRRLRQLIRLDAPLVIRPAPRPIDRRRAHNRRLDPRALLRPRRQHNLIHIAMRRRVRQAGDLLHAVPVIKHLLRPHAIRPSLHIRDLHNPRAGRVDQEARARILPLCQPSDECVGAGFVVGVCLVTHDVGFGGLLGQEGGAVEVAVDEADGGVL